MWFGKLFRGLSGGRSGSKRERARDIEPLLGTRKPSDRKLAKGVLSVGRPRVCKPGTPIPRKPVIYRHASATGRPYRFGASFDAAARIAAHRRDPALTKKTVSYQIARDGVTPAELFAAERVKIRKHRTDGPQRGNRYRGGNGNVPKSFRLD